MAVLDPPRPAHPHHPRPLRSALLDRALSGTASRRLRRRWRRAVRADVQPMVTSMIDSAIESVRRVVVEQDVVPKITSELAPLRTAQQKLADQVFTDRLLLGAGSRVDRALSEQRHAQLVGQLQALTGERELTWPLLKAYRGLLDAETRGLGRIAGSTPNVLAKLVATPLLGAPAGPVLEIGTLFGLFAPVLMRQFAQYGEFRELSVVDPFAGLQLQTGAALHRDHTRTPVTEDVARSNFATLGLAPERYRLITGYSGDAAIQAQVADRDYAVVIIDGDHSEDGVLADLRWVERIVRPGAVVVMDDFGDRLWPGVERAVHRYLGSGGRLQLVGSAASSAFLRAPGADT